MKNIKTLFAVIAIGLLSTFSISANEIGPKSTNQQIREKIINLLGNKIPLEIQKDDAVEISFMFNTKSEVVILSVGSENNSVDKFVKSRLNYKTLKVKGIKKGEIYKVPLKLKKS